jgi:hypothetical protein
MGCARESAEFEHIVQFMQHSGFFLRKIAQILPVFGFFAPKG